MQLNPFSIFGTAIGAVAWAGFHYLHEPDFLVVRELSQTGQYITFDRAIRSPDTIADWSVTIVDAETGEPVCTGGGRDEYSASESRVKHWHIDAFTGDEGCWDRLPVGESTAYVAWHPIDGRATVFKTLKIEKRVD